MGDPGPVRCGQPVEKLEGDVHQLARWQSLDPLQTDAQRFAVEKLHDDVALAIGQSANVQNLENVVVPDATRRLGFALEPVNHFGIAGYSRMQNLDRNLASNTNIFTKIHRSHAAFAEAPDHAVLVVDQPLKLQGHAIGFNVAQCNRWRLHD